jgi:dienelactone hydrolase
MANPKTPAPGRPHLARDNQQWLLDWLIKETGRVQHFQGDARGNLPRSVRNHGMISKHVGQAARRLELLAEAEAAAGHSLTALTYFYKASLQYIAAQHVIFENTDEKRTLYAGARRCYAQVIALAPHRIEHVDIPWEGTTVSGNLHLCNAAEPAPCIFYIPGCDVAKENWPHPLHNPARERGMHVFAFDGPGQAESNLRGIKLTADNYERAASAALDYLVSRPEIDAARIGLYATSFGSFWGMRAAAADQRFAAIAAPYVSVCDKYFLMTEEGPRWKQLFGYLTQSTTEAELDATMEAMTMDGYMERIACPALLMVGEYDPRSPLQDVYRLFDQMTAPAELWVFADQHHQVAIGGESPAEICCDWLLDRFQGKPLAHPGQALYLDQNGPGPNSPAAARKRIWYDALPRE